MKRIDLYKVYWWTIAMLIENKSIPIRIPVLTIGVDNDGGISFIQYISPESNKVSARQVLNSELFDKPLTPSHERLKT